MHWMILFIHRGSEEEPTGHSNVSSQKFVSPDPSTYRRSTPFPVISAKAGIQN